MVNNIEQLRLLVLKLPLQLDWAQLEQRMRGIIEPQQIQNALHNQLDSTVACLDHEVRDVVQALATKVTTCPEQFHPRCPEAHNAPGMET